MDITMNRATRELTERDEVHALAMLVRAGQRAAAAKAVDVGSHGPSRARPERLDELASDFDRAVDMYKKLMREREERGVGRGVE